MWLCRPGAFYLHLEQEQHPFPLQKTTATPVTDGKEQRMSINFTIEAGPQLVRQSRKPKHLSARLSRAAKGAAIGSAAKAQLESDEQAHLSRHDQFLIARKVKLQKRLEHVSAVLEKQRSESSMEALSAKKTILDQTLANANKKRSARLDQLAKTNACHVRRAKAIAKSSQQKFIEDRVLLARSIERKRRISITFRMSSVPRSRLLDPESRASLQHLAAQEHAATSIQTWYRKLKFDPIRRIYKKIGLSREKAALLSFEKLTARISAATVIKATGFLIIRAKRITGDSTTFKNPARVLNSAFMFTFFPKETLTANDGQEEVRKTSQPQLTCIPLSHHFSFSSCRI